MGSGLLCISGSRGVWEVPGCDKGDRSAAFPCPSRPPDTVDIVLDVLRDIVVDYKVHIVDVDPACRHISCNQDFDGAFPESAHDPITLGLLHVAVEFFRAVAACPDTAGEIFRASLRIAEDDRKMRVDDIDHPGEGLEFVTIPDLDIGLFCGRDGEFLVLDPDKFGLVLEPF